MYSIKNKCALVSGVILQKTESNNMNIYLLLNSEYITGGYFHTYVFILQFKLLLGDNSGKNHLIIIFQK